MYRLSSSLIFKFSKKILSGSMNRLLNFIKNNKTILSIFTLVILVIALLKIFQFIEIMNIQNKGYKEVGDKFAQALSQKNTGKALGLVCNSFKKDFNYMIALDNDFNRRISKDKLRYRIVELKNGMNWKIDFTFNEESFDDDFHTFEILLVRITKPLILVD